MTGPSDKAVEAAAEAFARKRNPRQDTLGYSESVSIRAALNAALPHVRAALADEIEAHIATEPTLMHVTDWRDAMETAVSIVRGEES